MPHYQYEHDEQKECKGFEYFQKMTDETLKICPDCKQPIHRLISGGTGLIFKGGGWYRDGYASAPKMTVEPNKKEIKKEN